MEPNLKNVSVIPPTETTTENEIFPAETTVQCGCPPSSGSNHDFLFRINNTVGDPLLAAGSEIKY